MLLSVLVSGHLFLSFVTKRVYSGGIVFFSGLCLLGIISNLLLLAGIFERPYLLAILGVVWIAFLWRNRSTLRAPLRFVKTFQLPALSYFELALFVCLGAVMLVFIVLNFVPISGADAFGYHLPFVRDFILSGHINQPIAGIKDYGYGYFPALAEIIFASGILLSGLSSLVQPVIALQAGIMVALVWALYSETSFLAPSRSARLIPLLVLFIVPNFRDSILFVGYIDLILDSVIVIGVLLTIRFLRLHEKSDMYLGALFLGCSLAMKYPALISATYCACAVLMVLYISPAVRSLWRTTFFSAAIGALIPAYWYVKNWILFHNPVFPLLSGSTADDAIRNATYLPHVLWVKLLYPVLVYMTFLFMHESAHLIIANSILTLGGIFGLLVLFIKTRHIDLSMALLLGFFLFYSWGVSVVSDDIRFNMPALIILVVLDAALLQQLFNSWAPRYTKIASYAFALCFAGLLPLMLHSYGARLAVLRGAESSDFYITTQSPPRSVAGYTALMNLR